MSTIPYAAESRPDTGFTNARLGTLLLLFADFMLLASLVSVYAFLRVAADFWPTGSEVLPRYIAGLNMLVLTLSAVTATKAWRSARDGGGIGALVLTCLLGMAFVGILGWEHDVVGNTGALARTNTFYATYYLITGAFGFHILFATFAALWLVGPGAGLKKQNTALYTNRIACLTMTWQFMTLMGWIIFALFYTV